MAKKRIIVVMLIIAVLIIAAFFVLDYFKNQKEGDIYDYFKEKANLESGSQIKPNDIEFADFVSEDGEFQMKYPAKWIKSEVKDLTQITPKNIVEKYNLKMPLMSTLPEAGKLVQIAVTEYDFSATKNAEDIFKELVSDTDAEGLEVLIISKSFGKNQATFEINYKQPNLTLHSKEKLFLLPTVENIRKGYVASFVTLENNWNEYSEVANFVINSAEVRVAEEDINEVKGGVEFGGYLSDLYLAKLPLGKNFDSPQNGAPEPATEFDFSRDQFCATGFIIKPYEETQVKIYPAGKNEAVFTQFNSLGMGRFGGCQKMLLENGAYEFNMYFDDNLAATIPFTVK